MPASLPRDDVEGRVAALRSYGILDTKDEEIFDGLTRLASQICETPICLVSFVDEHRQWFKSTVGIDLREMPREMAFCTHALSQPEELFVVPDAMQDARFADNPLVTGEPHIRFYAGAPLVSPDRHPLGTLCVIDRKPRELTVAQTEALRLLARQVVSQLEARRNLTLLQATAEQLELQRSETQLILDHVPAYVLYKDTKNRIIRVNQPVAEALDLPADQIEGRHATELYPERAEMYFAEDLEVIRSGVARSQIDDPLPAEEGKTRWISTDKIPIRGSDNRVEGVLVVASDITRLKEAENELRETQSQLRHANLELAKQVKTTAKKLEASELRFSDLYHNAPDLFASIDVETGLVLKCNNKLLRELDRKRDEVIGQPVSRLYHECCRDQISTILEELKTVGEVRNREMTLQRRDGSRIEVGLSVTAIYDESGRVVSSRSVFRDISEKKRLEEDYEKRVDQLAHMSRIATINEVATGLAHEINQPLFAIKNYAQGALRRLRDPSRDADSLVTPLEDIVAAADRAAELIVGLRRFVEPGGKQLSIANAEALAKHADWLVQSQLRQHGIELTIEPTAPLPPVACDVVRIEQVLVNVLLNASEALSKMDGLDRKIRLRIKPQGRDRVQFSITDNGPGFRGVDTSRLHEAFYTTKKSGLGMGLAICRTILGAHGSVLEARTEANGGATFEFSLCTSLEKVGSASTEPHGSVGTS